MFLATISDGTTAASDNCKTTPGRPEEKSLGGVLEGGGLPALFGLQKRMFQIQ